MYCGIATLFSTDSIGGREGVHFTASLHSKKEGLERPLSFWVVLGVVLRGAALPVGGHHRENCGREVVARFLLRGHRGQAAEYHLRKVAVE